MFMRIPQRENLVQMKLYWCLNNIVHTHGAISTAPRSFPGRQSCDSADLVPSTEAGVVTDDFKVQKERAATIPKLKGPLFQVHGCTAMRKTGNDVVMCVAKVPFLCKHSHLRINDCLREY